MRQVTNTCILHKREVFEKVKEFEKLVANKFGQTIRVLRSDNGREFCNWQMNEYLVAHGIKKENTAPYTPQQNGKAERDNRTIVESARTMLYAKGLSLNLWAEAINTAVYVLNRTIVNIRRSNAIRVVDGEKTKHQTSKNFRNRSICPRAEAKKFDLRARKMILVGYQSDSENYRVYDPTSKKVSVTRDVTFNEQAGKEAVDTRKSCKETICFSPPTEAEEDDDEESLLNNGDQCQDARDQH